MKVRVLSKNQFDSLLPRMRIDDDNVETNVDSVFISIVGSDGHDYSYFNRDHCNVLRLIFDDITQEQNDYIVSKGEAPLLLFNKEHADAIIKFIERNKVAKICYVHCLAGVSRSGAVGTFINDICGYEKFTDFVKSNPYIMPNYYILTLLKRVYNNIALDD